MEVIKQLDLPSVYENRNNIPEYKKYEGRPQLSYSSYNSFLEEAYQGEFFGNKFLGLPREGSIFTEFGSCVGSHMETAEPQDYLTDSDLAVLAKENPADPTVIYEQEIVIDRGSYVIIGFIDRLKYEEEGAYVDDFKTGSIEKKAKEYASDDYQQTTLYSYAVEQMGVPILYSGVVLFDRKGNTLEAGNKNVLRLTGDIEYIPTPYSTERAEKFLKKFDKVALEIESYYKVYCKYFK